MNLNSRKYIYRALPLMVLIVVSCGGDGGGAGTDSANDYPVDAALATELVGQGMPLDMAEFFAAARFSSNCSGDTTTCSFTYLYPNEAMRELTLTATAVQYTPTASELASTALVSRPVFDGKFSASGIEDTPTEDTLINISYFVPSSSLPQGALAKAQIMLLAEIKAERVAAAPGDSNGYQFNLSESGSKGADVAIGSVLDLYKDLGKSVKSTGSIYAAASALSDIAGAMSISKEVSAWLSELDDLEKCAKDPNNPLTQSDPNYTDTAVATVQAARSELKQLSAVRFLNAMDETAMGIHPVAAVLSIPLKQANAWSEQTLQDLSKKLMEDVRKAVVSCKPSCPTGFSATGISESEIDLAWSASTVSSGVTSQVTYIVSGGNLNGAETTALTFQDTGLEKSTTYSYTISAYNEFGSSESCPQVEGTTLGPPKVDSTGPFNNTTNVSVKTAVSATFSEEVVSATITASGTFTLGGVGGTVSYSGTTATFTPSADLAYSTTYTATVTTAVLDLDGIAMEADYTWSFTTEAAPVAGNLQFSLDILGDILASGSASVTWTKYEDLGDVRSYVPSGTITADINVADCDPMNATVPIYPTVPFGFGPTLSVYTATNGVYPSKFAFAMSADDSTLTFTCGTPPNRYTLDLVASTIINFIVGICPSTGFAPLPFTNEAVLAGTYSCPVTGLLSATWDFSK